MRSSASTNQELVQLDIARQNANQQDSFISTAYSWYQWGRAVRTLGKLALSANPSGAFKFAAQLALQPIADKVAKITDCPNISSGMRVAIACSDPLGSAISYGTQWATNKVLESYEFNPHVKAVLQITSQEASSHLTTTLKSTQTYKATSDHVTQKIGETRLGATASVVQKKIDSYAEKFDNHSTVKTLVEKGNRAADSLSKKVETLPGAQKVASAKKWVEEKKETFIKKMDESISSSSLIRKAQQADQACATRIRNSRLTQLETRRQVLEDHLRIVRRAKKKNENLLKENQQRKAEAEKSRNEAEIRRTAAEVERYEKLVEHGVRGEKSVMSQLNTVEKHIRTHTVYGRGILLKELNNKLTELLARERQQENQLKKSQSSKEQESIKSHLKKTREEINETRVFSEACLSVVNNPEGGITDELAEKLMPTLKKLREKNKVIVRVWLPLNYHNGELTSQKESKKLGRAGNPGHVSIELANGENVSFVPFDDPVSKNTPRPAQLNTYREDYQLEHRHADRVFSFYTLNTEMISKELAAIKSRIEKSDFGWDMYDNKLLRAYKGRANLTPIGNAFRPETKEPVSETSSFATDNATSCVGFVKKLLIAGGIDKLSPLPVSADELTSRYVLASPENFSQLLESAELAENATYPETRHLRGLERAMAWTSRLFKKAKPAVRDVLPSKVEDEACVFSAGDQEESYLAHVFNR